MKRNNFKPKYKVYLDDDCYLVSTVFSEKHGEMVAISQKIDESTGEVGNLVESRIRVQFKYGKEFLYFERNRKKILLDWLIPL